MRGDYRPNLFSKKRRKREKLVMPNLYANTANLERLPVDSRDHVLRKKDMIVAVSPDLPTYTEIGRKKLKSLAGCGDELIILVRRTFRVKTVTHHI